MAKLKKLQPTEENLHCAAIGNVFDVLTGKKEFDDKTQLAMKYLNYESRGEQLGHSKTKLAFSMVRVLADQEVLQKYVASTEPAIKKLMAKRV